MLSWISVNTEPVYYSTPAIASEPDAVVTTIVDITDRKNHEQLLALEKKVLEMNALPAISIKTIIDYFLEGLEKLFPGMLCTVLTLDHQKQTVHPLSAPSLPVEYSEAINWKTHRSQRWILRHRHVPQRKSDQHRCSNGSALG